MKFDKPNRARSADYQSTGITAENWSQRAKACIAGRGPEALGFVVRGIEGQKGSQLSKFPATEPQWLAWLAYLDAKGIPTKAMRFHGLATVPTEWPEEFDLECEPSNRTARIPAKPISRGSVDFSPLVRKVENWGNAKRKAPPVKTDEWLMEYGRQPITLGEGLRSRLGFKDAAE